MPRTQVTAVEEKPQSVRRKRQRQLDVIAPIDQIRVQDAGANIEATGAYAYYINPAGATISDALILYPNGGVPDIDDLRLKSRYGENASYYQERQKRKGFEYIGQNLTEGGIRRLIEVLAANKDEEILFCEEEIADARQVAENSDIPEVRNQAKRRIRQLEQRVGYLNQTIDADELEAELNSIAQAQQLAKVDPAVLRVMRSMVGALDAKVEGYMSRFAKAGKPGTSASSFEGASHLEAGPA